MSQSARALVAEVLGSFTLLFIGGLSIIVTLGFDTRVGKDVSAVVVISFGFGLALLAGLYAFGEISGGHYNPAVSLGALLDGRLDAATFVQYTLAQVAGAVLAGVAMVGVSSVDLVAQTATVPGAAGTGGAFLLEVILTAIFVAVILKVTTSDTMGPSAFLGIPLTLVAIHLGAATLSGASVNPARSLGSAIMGNNYTDIWIYLTAPFIGAVLGWIFYAAVVGRTREDVAAE